MELTLKSSDIINRSVKQHDIYYYTEGKMYDRLVAHMKDRKAIYRITDTEVRWTKNQMCPTLTANMGTHKDRVHVVWDDYGIRKITLREGLDFQGFPKEFYFPNTITIDDAYKQIGNTVSVPVIARLGYKNQRNALWRNRVCGIETLLVLDAEGTFRSLKVRQMKMFS